MALVVVAVVFTAVLAAIALRADAALPGESRLPMQWWLDGRVTWSAPRGLALAFVPALAVLVFAASIALATNVRPRAGQEHLVLPIMIGMGVMFVAVQLLHLWLVRATLARRG